MVAAIIVAAIAFSASLLARDGGEGADVTLPSTALTVAPAPEVEQPSEETWEELLPRLEAALDAAPDDVNLKRKLALAYYNLGRYGDAVAIYEDLLTAQEDAVLRSRLGNTLRDMGDTAGAEAAYRKAIQDDPALAPPYLDLAELLWRQGRDGEALSVIDQGLAAVPVESRSALEQGRATIQAATDGQE